jgi:hypothetical protein
MWHWYLKVHHICTKASYCNKLSKMYTWSLPCLPIQPSHQSTWSTWESLVRRCNFIWRVLLKVVGHIPVLIKIWQLPWIRGSQIQSLLMGHEFSKQSIEYDGQVGCQVGIVTVWITRVTQFVILSCGWKGWRTTDLDEDYIIFCMHNLYMTC